MTSLTDLSEGTEVGYFPVGAPDVREVGIVKDVDTDARRITVSPPDDPGIEERVPFRNVESIDYGDGHVDAIRDRIDGFAAAVEDVPGVEPRTRGFGDGAFVRVDVAFDYKNRDEFGDGKVAVAPNADPVGKTAFERDLRIVRSQPFPDDGKMGLWFATVEHYADVARGSE